MAALTCGECGVGNYRDYTCTHCGHVVDARDILPHLDEGEELTTVDGLLAVHIPPKRPRLRNINNVAAFGVEWQEVSCDDPDKGGSQFQLVLPRNTATLLLGMRRNESKKWSIIPVTAPKRFGITGPVGSYVKFNEIVEAWFATQEEQK